MLKGSGRVKIGFIGMGNMAQAILRGFLSNKCVKKENVFAYAPSREKLMHNAVNIGFIACASDEEVCEKSDLVFIACKPYQIEDVLKKCKDPLKGKAIVSIAAGGGFDKYEALIPDTRIQTVMPNTPVAVGEGVVLFEEKNTLTEDELKTVRKYFESTGIVETVPGNLMGIAGTLTGCGPAFVDLFIEAYADAGVKYGLKRDQAYRLVSAMIKGSASLQLATGKHPGVLKDEVCSPGGTTIRGVTTLERDGFRNACIESIDSILK